MGSQPDIESYSTDRFASLVVHLFVNGLISYDSHLVLLNDAM